MLVLGPCAVLAHADDDEPAALTAVQQRLVARLALDAPLVVPPDDLVRAVWGQAPPATARAALRNQVSRLRKRFGSGFVSTDGSGYALAAPTDVGRVVADVDAAERALRRRPADHEAAFDLAHGALGRWRGTPLAGMAASADVVAARRRLDELRAAAENLRLEAAIAAGRVGWAVPEAERLVGDRPLDEHRWVLLVDALDAAGRRGDALGAVDRARTTLRDRAGLAPGPGLRAAAERLLAIDGEVPSLGGDELVVGRDAELAAVAESVLDDRPVLVLGESGVGKTCFVDAVASTLRSDGRRVAVARCAATPATAAEVLVDLLVELGETTDPVSGPVDGFPAAVRRAADLVPVVLCIDDVHLAGPSSLAAIEAAGRLAGVTVVATAEPSWSGLPGPDAHRLVLGGLGADAVGRLAAGTGRRLAPAQIDWLTQMSGGNPRFLACLLDDEAVVAALDDGTIGGTAPPPAALGDVVRRRLGRLGPRARDAIEVLAVVGSPGPRAVLAALDGDEGIADAVAQGLVVLDGDSARFRHGAVRRVVELDLAPGRRLELHHAVGTALVELGGTATTVAHHLLAAAALDPRAAIAAARAAAGEATAQGAHRDAARWAARAVAVAEGVEPAQQAEAVAARIEEGDALRLAGDPSHIEVLFDAADRAVALDDPALLGSAAFALLQLGASTESGGLDERAVAVAEQAMATVVDPEQRAAIAAAASLAHSMSGHTERCQELFAQAEAAAVSSAARRVVLPFAYLALGHPRHLDRREALARELLDRAAEAGDAVARFEGLHLWFSCGLQRADGDRVRHALDEMGGLVDRVGDVGRRWALAYQSAAVAHLDDDLERSERLSAEALELFAPVAASRAMAAYSAQVLVLRMAQGRVDELAGAAADLVADQPGVPAWHAVLALATAASDPATSRSEARAALEDVPEDFTWLAAHVIGGRAAAIAGDDDTRAEYARRLAPWQGLVCWQGTCAFGPVDTVLALLARAAGDGAAADGHARVARDLATSLRAPVFVRELDEAGLVG